MNQEHFTIQEYSEVFAGEAEPEKEERMLAHLEDCALCKVKMKAATLFALLEDDEVLDMTFQMLKDANKDADTDTDEEEDFDL